MLQENDGTLMDLGRLVMDLSMDYSYLAGSIIAANSLMYYVHKKEPMHLQHKLKNSPIMLAGIDSKGSRYFFYNARNAIEKTGIIALALYGLDSLLAMDDKIINLHNAFCYGAGSFLYISSLANYIDFMARRLMVK